MIYDVLSNAEIVVQAQQKVIANFRLLQWITGVINPEDLIIINFLNCVGLSPPVTENSPFRYLEYKPCGQLLVLHVWVCFKLNTS